MWCSHSVSWFRNKYVFWSAIKRELLDSKVLGDRYIYHSPHRGRLLFMRCVSLTLTGLICKATRETCWPIPCHIVAPVICLGQWRWKHFKVFEILKTTRYFQTNGIFSILNWDVRCNVVSDAGSTCYCCLLFFLTVLHLIGEPLVQCK